MSKKTVSLSARRPRRPEPFFRTQTRSWYVQIRGRQISLGPDRKAAWDKYDELMRTGEAVGTHARVAELLDEFLEYVKNNRAEATFVWYQRYLGSFVGFVGMSLRVSQVKTMHVTKWLDASFVSRRTTSRSCAVRAVKAAFNWAVEQGYLERSPLKGVKRPPAARREMVLTVSEFQSVVLSRCRDQVERDLLTFLWETGARVQEVRRISARHYEKQIDRIVLKPSEDKVKHYRAIYLTEVAREIICRLSEVHPDGALFRNRVGKPWTSNAIRCRFRKFGVPGLCGTILRHSFCQRLLTSGVDSVTVGELMGHRDLTMVARTYSHLTKDAEFLRHQLRKPLQMSESRP